MIKKEENYFINNPFFVKYKKKFSFTKLSRIKYLKTVYTNERIIEIPFVLQSIPSNKKFNILDLGCSASPLPIYMATLGHKVIGVDFRKYPYKHPNFRFKQADILSMPFPDDKFDIVTCISTLEHIGLGFYGDSTSRDSPDKKAILQITRTLKEGGLFLFSVPFGMKQKNSQQRIYDSDTINLLFKNFRILEKAFYKNFSGDELNYWDKISEEEAKKVYSKDGSTNCIILIKAKTRV